MGNKVIGIISSRTKFTENFRMGSYRTYVASDYIESVRQNGGIPIIIPLIDDEEKIRSIVRMCDGIVLSGGDDINPILYKEECTKYQGMIDELRDKVDYIAINEALDKSIGILGICRGMQILNVYFGGTLFQDISLIKESNIAHVQSSDKNIATHSINVMEGCNLYNIFGQETWVNSFHHQCINKVAKEFKITAISKDGIIEGIELKNNNKVYGVQWHPEMMDNYASINNIFKGYVELLK